MENENAVSKLKTEQLYSESFFTHFCERDEVDGRKIEKRITKEFLDACEKDALVVPLLVQKGVVLGQNGTKEETDVRYYSPFQIFFIAALSENEIDEEGYLRDLSTDWKYQREQKVRFVNWGGVGAFNATLEQTRKTDEVFGIGANYYRLADEFHQFLRLLHSLEEEKGFNKKDPSRSRYFQRQPPFQYVLDPLRENAEAYLADYDLDLTKLKKLVANIGYFASQIDPLERWYHYIQRHAQWRRDTLKGKAALAQDLYGLCDVLYEVIELISGEKMPPLPDYIHSGIKPYNLETPGYAQGADIKAVQSASRRLREWIDAHKSLIAEISPFYFRGESGDQAKLDEQLTRLENVLADYEKRYGDKRYTGGLRVLEPEEKLKVTDLDENTRRYVEMTMAQYGSIEKKNGKTYFTTSFDELAEKVRKGEMTYEEAEKQDREFEIKHNITRAIESTLDDLARDVMTVAGNVSEAIWPLVHKAEHEKEMATPNAWREFGKRIDPKAPDYAAQRARFWQTGLKEFQKPYDDKISELHHAQTELHGIVSSARLVFCKVCREKPVRLHYGHNDNQVSVEAVCDECFNKQSEKTLQATEEDWKKIKYAEWQCRGCRERTLIKYALENVISLEAKNKVAIQIVLDYGRMQLQAKCPKCGMVNSRAVDWGWHP